MKTKKCKICEEYKTLDNFSKLKHTNKEKIVFYFHSYCKKCLYDKYKRGSSEKSTNYIKNFDKEYHRRKRALNPDKKRIEYLKYKEKYPERIHAHEKVYYAVKTGKLKKDKCRDCDRIDTQGHHPDYSKPLEVIWLCPPHHKLEDMKGRILLENNQRTK